MHFSECVLPYECSQSKEKEEKPSSSLFSCLNKPFLRLGPGRQGKPEMGLSSAWLGLGWGREAGVQSTDPAAHRVFQSSSLEPRRAEQPAGSRKWLEMRPKHIPCEERQDPNQPRLICHLPHLLAAKLSGERVAAGPPARLPRLLANPV